MHGRAFPPCGLAGDYRADPADELHHGAAERNVALMIIEPFHDMHHTHFAVVCGEAVQEQPQGHGASEWQGATGQQRELLEGFGIALGQEISQGDLNGKTEQQDHGTGDHAGKQPQQGKLGQGINIREPATEHGDELIEFFSPDSTHGAGVPGVVVERGRNGLLRYFNDRDPVCNKTLGYHDRLIVASGRRARSFSVPIKLSVGVEFAVIKVGIVGGTGYTGVELLRLLAGHPEVEVVAITSRSDAGVPVAEMFPNLRGFCELAFSEPDEATLAHCDLVFFATPHGVAMRMVPGLMAAGVRVVDLSADFRLRDLEVWAQWYGMLHESPEWAEKAVYGLPEVARDRIREAQLVANPGCYPTAIQLGFLPLLENNLVNPGFLVADGKSGASGAGRQGKIGMLHGEIGESFKAYGASGHRHLPEIREGLRAAARVEPGITFVPHLVPMVRGIEATLYAQLHDPADFDRLQALYEERFRSEPFVDVMPAGSHPETRSVRGGNMCRMALHRQENSPVVIVTSVIDNLVKGAAGQAIQNMNIMFGIDETHGLNAPALLP